MKKLLVALLPLSLAVIPSSAAGRSFVNPGALCAPAVASSASCLTYNQFGVSNGCSTTQTVECPLPVSYPGAGATVNQSFYDGYDRNSSSDVSCSLQKTDFAGNILFSSTANTSGSAAGVQQPTFSVSTSVVGYWRLRCSIPGATGSGVSHVVSAFVGDTE